MTQGTDTKAHAHSHPEEGEDTDVCVGSVAALLQASEVSGLGLRLGATPGDRHMAANDF